MAYRSVKLYSVVWIKVGKEVMRSFSLAETFLDHLAYAITNAFTERNKGVVGVITQ